MNSPLVASACWQAAVSRGDGVTNVPPWLRRGVLEDRSGDTDPEHPVSSNAASDAATAPALCRKRRRSMPRRCVASSTTDRISAFVAMADELSDAGTNSPLETGPAGSGRD